MNSTDAALADAERLHIPLPAIVGIGIQRLVLGIDALEGAAA